MADLIQTNLTLQEAYGRAKHALEAGAPERAIAIAQHILRYYPRYLDAYRLLGEAYLERGQIDDAHRLFSHVLQGDPQNVLAHIGRGIVADERGDTDIAIDEYERAFEIDPSIPELRSELLRLYTGRYGSAGATIRTTPSGLAYVHLRAGLRDAAISELSHAAQMRPDRWDLEVALTEALWRNEQFDEAAAISADILAGHPSCVKCHWILGYLHWTNGRIESGRQYLLDAVALDPTYSVAERLWEATPWPIDPNLTRRPPGLIPAWSGDALEATDLDLGLPLRTQELGLDLPPGAAVEGGRSTQKFRVVPTLPEAEPTPPAVEAAPLPIDLDWFDDWASAAETAAPSPAPDIAPLAVAAADAGSAPDALLVETTAAEEMAPALGVTAAGAEPGPPEVPVAPAPVEASAPTFAPVDAGLDPQALLVDTAPAEANAPGLALAAGDADLDPQALLGDTAPAEASAPTFAPAAVDAGPERVEFLEDTAPAEESAADLAPAAVDAGPERVEFLEDTAPTEESVSTFAPVDAEPASPESAVDAEPTPPESAVDMAPAEESPPILAPATVDAGPERVEFLEDTAPAEASVPTFAPMHAAPARPESAVDAEPTPPESAVGMAPAEESAPILAGATVNAAPAPVASQPGTVAEGGPVPELGALLEEPALPIEDVDTDAFLRWLTGESAEMPAAGAGVEPVPVEAMDEDSFLTWLASTSEVGAQVPADPDPAEPAAPAGHAAPAEGEEDGLYRQFSQSRL